MISPSQARRVQPVVVCGPPRCGTRFVTNALNAFPEVAVLGELEPVSREKAFGFIRSVDRAIAKGAVRKPWSKAYLRHRAYLVMVFWTALQKRGAVTVGAQTRYFGYKNPRHEALWSLYEGVFAATPPLYVYCVRNFRSHWLSVKTRWPHRTVEATAEAYLDSLATFAAMEAALGPRVVPFVLDDLIAHGEAYLEGFLRRLPFGQGDLPAIDPGEKANTAGAKKPPATLSEAEARHIAGLPELARGFEALRARHGFAAAAAEPAVAG